MKVRAAKTYVISAIGGLALAIAVGAIASNSGGSHPASSKTSARLTDASIARVRPDRAVMRVFSRASTANDTMPAAAIAQAQSLGSAPDVDPSVLPGALDTSNARLVASLPNGWQLFGMPSAKGWICAILVGPNAGGGCFLGYSAKQSALVGRSMDNGSQFAWGFVRDDVKSATIDDNGAIRALPLGKNGFLYKAAAGNTLNSVSFKLANGTTQTVSFGAWQSLHP